MALLKKAENTMAYFKCGMLGFPGSGKTYTSTLMAIGICKRTGAKTIAYFDTETGSDFLIPRIRREGFEAFQVKSRSFNDLITTIDECLKEKIGVLIIDSITHVWRDLCDSYQRKQAQARQVKHYRLQFQDWGVLKGKEEWGQYTDRFINAPLHMIACGRAGYEYDYDMNDDGTKDLVKTDIKMKVESEFGFEPSLVIYMERSSENKEAIKEFLGKKDRKSKDAKQSFKPTGNSKWIHRACILKDRTDTINGQEFENPTFDVFVPHFEALNIGGTHFGVDTERNSEDRFEAEGSPKWKREQTQKTIALEEIQGSMLKLWPSTSAEDKKAKSEFIDVAFGTRSWTAVEKRTLLELETTAKKLRIMEEIFQKELSIKDNWAEATRQLQMEGLSSPPPEDDDIPEPGTSTGQAQQLFS